MRDYVILHAPEDAAQAALLEHALGGRGAVSCALRSHAPVGNFGPQFMLIALWSSAAESGGLSGVMAKMFAGRARTPAIVTVGAARAPSALLAHTSLVMPLSERASAAYDIARQLMATGAVESETVRKPRMDHRKAMGFAATAATAMFSFAGSAMLAGMTPAAGNLAWAASDDAREPNVIVAPALAAKANSAVAASGLPDLDPILARADEVMAQAQAIMAAPAVQARFELVQRVAASDVDLRMMFLTPAPSPVAAAEPATELAVSQPTAAATPVEPTPTLTAQANEVKTLADTSLSFSGIDVATLN
jgi:hypothetical protein